MQRKATSRGTQRAGRTSAPAWRTAGSGSATSCDPAPYQRAVPGRGQRPCIAESDNAWRGEAAWDAVWGWDAAGAAAYYAAFAADYEPEWEEVEEWHALERDEYEAALRHFTPLLDAATNDERLAAARAYAERVGPKGVLGERWNQHVGALEREINARAWRPFYRGHPGGVSWAEVRIGAVEDAAFQACLEARRPAEEVTFYTDAGRKTYRLGETYPHDAPSAPLVPGDDLPPKYLGRFLIQRIRDHVLDDLLPGWREIEAAREAKWTLVSQNKPTLANRGIAPATAPEASDDEWTRAAIAELPPMVPKVSADVLALRAAEAPTVPEASAEDEVRLAAAERVLTERELDVMQLLGDQTLPEAAISLEIDEDTAKKRIQRGRQRLREECPPLGGIR